MRIAVIGMVALFLLAAPASAQSASPHDMVNESGDADTDKCALCHNEDFSLSRSKLETCTLCHSENLHAGAAAHLGVTAPRVARLVPPPTSDAVVLPLAEDGRMYCGTCHLFHDPRLSNEAPLPAPWAPAPTGLAESVRRSLDSQIEAAARKHGKTGQVAAFSDGTTRLRLSVDNGRLCRHCHEYAK